MSSQSLIRAEEITRQLMRASMGEKASALPFAEDIYLTTVSIAGMCFYDVDTILPNIKEDDALILRRNPKNNHDGYAIEVRTVHGQIIGHIPRSENRVLARLMDAGKRLTGFVKKGDNDAYWAELSVKILMMNM